VLNEIDAKQMVTTLHFQSALSADIPLRMLGAALAALGVLGIASRDFAFQWQPIAATLPGRQELAVAFGLLELLAGLLVLPVRSRRTGTVLTLVVLIGWTALHLPQVISRPDSMVNWLALAEPAAVTAAAAKFVTTAGRKSGNFGIERASTILFGLSAIVFGASHYVYLDFTASMIPIWLPHRLELAYLTGAGHALAGAAVTLDIVPSLAAGLEALMMLSFVVLVHVPRVTTHPNNRMEWTMLLVAAMLSASAALIAAMASRRIANNQPQPI